MLVILIYTMATFGPLMLFEAVRLLKSTMEMRMCLLSSFN